MATAAPKRRIKGYQFTIRVEEDVPGRADKLLEHEQLSRLDPHLQRQFVSRIAVLRECLLRGLADFEAELDIEPIAAIGVKTARKARSR